MVLGMASGAGTVKTSDVDAARCFSSIEEDDDDADFLVKSDDMVGNGPKRI